MSTCLCNSFRSAILISRSVHVRVAEEVTDHDMMVPFQYSSPSPHTQPYTVVPCFFNPIPINKLLFAQREPDETGAFSIF